MRPVRLGVDIKQNLSHHTNAFTDAERLVQVRVIDQSFPCDGGTQFLEINSYENQQLA